ncbi:MAG: SDR family NAD(P)-dependent oxidoreductase [Bacteroidetes bacterium]|nr:SDR family NAD(P)-dependent oxidoreductase [Bacteroidota bacterium]MBU1115411.1 SDR family NAD(P)-dependent oxidoreductase [Bacteroidota bacterium]MBU1797932.1 SDR family NAD(P)-dependent oxidoreductase [Bacteroidota bacterium]
MQKKQNCVWITGANSGIGKSITHQFAKSDIFCVASARRKDALVRMKDEVSEISNNIEIFPLDISSSDEISDVSKKILKKYDIDCLINNAGITTFTAAEDDSIEDVIAIIQINLIGSIATIQSLIPHFKKRGCGIIINILSVVATKVLKNSSIYSASKAGLLTYANVLREEVRKYNIKVINILPGATKTPIWSSEMLNKYANKMMSPDDLAKFIYHIYTLDSNLVPEEITIRPIGGDL